jgi:CDP-diacylglycerol--serine O-phosphatidyltransferase
MNVKKHIPNFLTTLNLFSGCVGILIAVQHDIKVAAFFIAFSAGFDFLDGLAARLLHVKSEIGKELDSLADVVSFGVLPGIIMYKMMVVALPDAHATFSIVWPATIALIVPVLSAVRLAKFNLDTQQLTSFIGLPVPADAILLGSLPLVLQQAYQSDIVWVIDLLQNYYFLACLSIGMALLLVSKIPLIALKFSSLSWQNNKAQYLLLSASVLVLVLFKYAALPLVILLYIGISLLFKPKATEVK